MQGDTKRYREPNNYWDNFFKFVNSDYSKIISRIAYSLNYCFMICVSERFYEISRKTGYIYIITSEQYENKYIESSFKKQVKTAHGK